MPAQRQLRSEPQTLPTAIGSSVAPTTAMPGGRAEERYEQLDGHRGIAVLAVVIFHVYQFCNVEHFLYFGTPAYTVLNSLDAMIPWFFVLTAFLLFEPIARSAIEGRPSWSARGFLTRRAVRLLPLYYVAVVIVWFTRQQTLPGEWRDLLEHLTFTQVFDEKRIFYTIGPAWAISVEVFFYLGLAGLGVGLVRICERLASQRQRIIVLACATGAVGVVSLAWKAWSFSVAHRPTTGSFVTWFGPLANLDNFAVGMAVALAVSSLGNVRPLGWRGRVAVRVAGLLVLTWAFATRQPDAWTEVYFFTFCAIGFGCLVAAAVLGPPQDKRRPALSRRTLLWLGTISYSIYLWHEPILLALRGSAGLVRQAPGAFVPDAAAVVVVSIVIGWLSYRIVERPAGHLATVVRRGAHRPASGLTKNELLDGESFRSGNPI